MLLLYVIIPVFGVLDRSVSSTPKTGNLLKSATSNKNNENNNIIINNDNYHYCYSNKITIMRCGLEVFFGRFRRISVIGCISVFLVTVINPYWLKEATTAIKVLQSSRNI